MRIISILNQPIGGCELYRQYMPNQLLGEQGWKVTHTNSILPEHLVGEFEYVQHDVEKADIYQFIRRDPMDMMNLARGYGMAVVMDIDDYWRLDQYHNEYDNYRKQKMPEHITFCLERADMVTTTNEYLAEKIRPHNNNVHVIPNAFTYREPQYTPVLKQDDGVVNIGWIGGSHHIADVAIMQKSMELLWNDPDLRGKFRFVFGGWLDGSEGHQIMAYIFSGRFNRHTEDRFLKLPATNAKSFMKMYDYCDLMIAPLRDTEFNRCKSNLKIIEAGSKKKPIICSDVLPYQNDGVITIPERKNKRGWYEAIREYILNQDKLKHDGDRLHSHVNENYSLEKVNGKRHELYCSLLRK